jgi:supervillin
MVFDFGSEMYVWSGKMAPLEVRKRAMRLAKELWDQGYDYSECAINPVFQRHTSAELSKGQQRPDWTLLRSAKQHMEPVLFREKFFDWPDKSGLIRVKNQDSDDNKTASGGGGGTGNDISSLEPYDAQLMLDYELEDPDLELEGAHLGRGVEYYDPAERRLQQVRLLKKNKLAGNLKFEFEIDWHFV